MRPTRGLWLRAAALALLGSSPALSAEPKAPASRAAVAAPQRPPSSQHPLQHEWRPADEARLAPHHARSLLEMTAGLALGTGGYWLLKDKNVTDWDNPKPLARVDGSAWVLDNNSIGVNFLGHPMTGALSYSFARANHQSVAGAFGYSFLTSFLWEFLIEFKEKVSVNDVIATPGCGLPIGEFFYKLGLYLDSGHHDSLWMDFARGVLGSGVALDRALDGRAPPHVTERDALGFSSAIAHTFDARYGVDEVSSSGEPSYARYHGLLSGRLVTLDGYGKPGRWRRPFWGGEISSFSLEAEASRYGWGLWVLGDTTLAGYHVQRLERVGGALRGNALTLGTSVGYAYLRSTANRYASVERAVALPKPDLSYDVPNRREQYAALQLPGLAADVSVARGWGRWQLTARVQPSLAGLEAPAFYAWAADHLQDRSKHILHRQGYFYGWGGALSGSTELELGPFRAGLQWLYAAYRSIDGLDRHPDELTVDVPATGDLLRYAASVGVEPERAGVSLALDWGERRFRSQVGGHRRTARAVERGVSARWLF